MFQALRTVIVTVVALALLCGTAAGQTLKVGDPAPPLSLGKFVKGEAVEKFEPGKVYVMEFWATWCGPCVAAIPHVSKLQQEYKDKGVVVIGVDVWENDPAAVAAFVKKMGDKMDYRVALDQVAAGEREGKMAQTWLKAAGQNGIPASMVINQQGRIVWIGHPMAGLEKVVDQVVKGEYDPAKAAAEAAKMQELQAKFQQAFQAKDWDTLLKLADEMEQAMPGAAEQAAMLRFNILARGKGDMAAANKAAAATLAKYPQSPQLLNELAWTMLDAPEIKQRDHDLALKIAQQAAEASKHEDAAILDTLARAHFDKGDVAKAVEQQQKAVEKADGEHKAELQKTLERYKSAPRAG